jgi:hypothetical protein
VIALGCWIPFKQILKAAGVEASYKEIDVSDVKRAKIDEIIHQHIGEKARYGHCSADWRTFKKEIQANEELRSKLVKALKSIV